MSRRRHVCPLLCYLLALAQLGWGLGCTDSISGGGKSQSSTVAGVLGTYGIGQVVFDLWRGQVASESPGAPRDARLVALDARRTDVIDAVDSIINARTLQGVGPTADALYALVDDGTLPGLTDRAAEVVDLLVADPRAQDAIVALLSRSTARSPVPADVVLELLGRLVNYPETEQLWTATAQLITENDGVDDQGRPNGEPTLAKDLLAFGSDAFRRAGQGAPSGAASTLANAFAPVAETLVEEATVRGTFDFGPPAWVVRVDSRGLPRVAIDPATGRLYAPFVDQDQDGLADVNGDEAFVDASGAVIDLPVFGEPSTPGFDQGGRATAGSGVPLYVFVDAKRTILALHLKVAGELLARDLHGPALDVLEAALGPRQPDGTYVAGPLTDLAWGGLGLLEPDGAKRGLRAAAHLVKTDPAAAERMLVSMARAHVALRTGATRSTFSASRLSDPRVVQLVDDLLPLLDDLLETPAAGGRSTGQVVLDTFGRLKTASPNFGAELAPLFTFKRVERELAPDADLNGIDEARSTPVDFALPPGTDNRSAVQQLLDLLVRADGCQLFGKSMAAWTIETMATLRPATVGTLASLLQALPGFLTNLFCSGISQDIQSLDALAKSGALDGFLPLAKAFVDQGQTELLIKLLARVQRAYPQTIRGIEPDVASFLDAGVLEELESIALQAQTIRDPVTGVSAADCLAEAAGILVDDDGVVLDRSGARARSRAHLLLAPVYELDRRVVAAGKAASFTACVDGGFDVLLARDVVGGVEVLKNGSLLPLVARLLESLEDAVADDAAQRAADVQSARQSVETALASKDLGTIVQLVRTIDRSPAKATITRSIVNLLTPNKTVADDIFGSVNQVGVYLLQAPQGSLQTAQLQGLYPWLATVLDPNRPLVPDAIRAIEHLLTADQGKTVLNVLRAAFNVAPGQARPPTGTLLVVFDEVTSAGRAAGGAAGPFDRVALESALRRISIFLRDDTSGLGYLYTLIKNRTR